MTNPADAFSRMRADLFRYYETPYRLRLEGVMRERRRLLDQAGATWQEPWVEVLRPYAVTGQGVEKALLSTGASEDLVSFGRAGLLEHKDVFEHQRDSLASALNGRNVAVTAGTGSGKTEAFLLPVIASILAESASWSGESPPARRWWKNSTEGWVPQRQGETGRLPGIRALILYPMNALVEDQLVRLRKALDSVPARQWLDTHRGGHRLYFGRYTGKTPVSGDPSNSSAVKRLRKHLVQFQERSDRVSDDARRPYLPRLDGAEMVSRWDMQQHPPDILITNYSMLNIALMRRIDQGLVDATRAWLEASPAHVFHVVVDELHMYRGTTGTEVAYLLRQLLHRLGLTPESPQVRFLATTASLGGLEEGRRFLADFFGASPDSFDIHEGRLQELDIPEGATLEPQAEQFSEWGRDPAAIEPDAAVQLLSTARVGDVLATAAQGRTVALSELDAAVFPGADPEQPVSAPFRGLLAAVERAAADTDVEVPRIRTHLFFRNIDGMWACVDPACKYVDEHDRHPDRLVGKLWARPRHRCECGDRVLRLMYCQTCGDLFLGGFLAPSLHDGRRLHEGERFLVAELGDLESLPDKARERETSRDFTIYWPRPVAEEQLAVKKSWTRGGYTFEFRPAVLDHDTGRLEIKKIGQTGWTFEVSDAGVKESEIDRIPPLPIYCPQCGTDWELFKTVRPVHDRSRTRSSIRTMGTGYEKLSQVLIDGLVRQLRPSGETARRLVLFSDSRQDAAKLSAGLEKRHYQDLLRELIVQELLSGTAPDVPAAIQFALGERSDSTRAAWRDIKARFGDLHAALRELQDDEPGALDRVHEAARDLEAGRTITQVASAVERALVAIGLNPAGPDPSTNREPPWREDGVHWTSLYEWPEGGQPRQRPDLSGSPALQDLRRRIDSNLLRECLLNVFSGNGRDLESLALSAPSLRMASKTPPEGMGADTFFEVVRASLRILGDDRRLQGLKAETDDAPANLRRYWARVAEQHEGISAEELADRVRAAWGPAVLGYLVQPGHLRLRPPGGKHFECPSCSRRHLDRAGGVCTSCSTPLPVDHVPARHPEDDYYAHQAKLGEGGFRLHAEELTGQTDDHEAVARQARFQDVFLHDENPRVDGVDVLSVTTTMEAGVDIGALRAVVMSNMPPMRFNYQQRVGRAGRRRDPFSFALTICRARSHDEYYFGHPDRITNDPPPSPYIDLSRPEILRRSIAAAVLRDGYRALSKADPSIDLGTNVHGEFGSIDAWPKLRGLLSVAIEAQKPSIVGLVDALLARAPDELMAQRDQLIMWATSAGPDSLVAAAEAQLGVISTQTEVSQHLAERGVLPMFGFPTRVRDMFLRRPKRTYPWPPSHRVDRQLELATIDFAPGAETVRDKQVHTAVGLAAYRPAGPNVVAEKDPIGQPHALTLCRRCGTVQRRTSATPAASCTQCSAATPDYGSIELAEPAGFRSSFRSEDFEGSFTRNARATAPRVLPDLSSMSRVNLEAATVFSGPGDVFVINDNGGRLYRFAPTTDEDSWISVDLWRDQAARQRLRLNAPLDLDRTWEGALGMVKRTDTMLFGISTPPEGVDLRPFDPGRRGAWYSLAFLLRAVGSRILDVGPQEFDAGYSVRQVNGEPHVEAFLADALENGAGYATRLGRPDQLQTLLDAAAEFAAELEKPPHDQCDSSCPDCLRDFTNLIFHPLLDWRLGRDLLEMSTGHDLDTDRWAGEEESLAQAFAADFFGTAVRVDGGAWVVHGDSGVVVIRHPLEAPDDSTEPNHAALTERMDRAFIEAESLADGRPIDFVSSFDLQRRPGWVVAKVM